MNNVKNVISQPLTADNHPLWRSQVMKLFRANGFDGFLDGSTACPPPVLHSEDGQSTPNPAHLNWILLDQNLAAALYSVISATILPYVLSVDHCTDIWQTIERRLQSSTRSRISQLKNELHYLSMKDKPMTQYLLEIKTKIDSLAAAGSPINDEEVIHYTLNGLPQNYQAFKTAIRTNLRPVTLDELYTLLCSEELNLAHEATKEIQSLQISGNNTAFTATRGRGRGRNSSSRGHNTSRSNNNSNYNRSAKSPKPSVTCQICGKFGHTAVRCWYRHDDTYNSDPSPALFTSPNPQSSSDWFLDSGASSHLTSDPNQIQNAQPYNGSSKVVLGNGTQLPIQNTGNGILPTPTGNLQLSKLNLVPNLSFNLLSVHRLTSDNNCLITFSSFGYEIKDRTTHRRLLTGPCINGLYPFRTGSSPKSPANHLALLSCQHVPDMWHRRLGHPSPQTLLNIAKNHKEICIPKTATICNTCQMAKSHRLHSNNSQSVTKFPFSLVHSDVWGPAPTVSLRGYKFYVSFVDDFTKFTWVYPLIHKSDVFSTFIEFQNMVERQFNRKIMILRSDNGGEFLNKKFQTLFKLNGIIHQLTCPHSPSQNGVAERKHRHLMETTRTLLIQASIPQHLWVDTLLTAAYLINQLPSSNTHHKSPYELLFGKTPSYERLRIFGCLCYPWLKPYSSNKLAPLSIPCVFIGYASAQKGYRCLDLKTNRIYTSCHVIFNESVFPYATYQSSQPTPLSITPNTTPPLLLVPTHNLPNSITKPLPSVKNNSPSQDQSIAVTAPPRLTTPNQSSANTTQNTINSSVNLGNSHPSHRMITRFKSGKITPKHIFDLTHIIHSPDPTTYHQANKSQHWRTAMSQEFQALQSQGTWDLVAPEDAQNVLGCKWTFRTKFNSDGSVARHKARLVAKGFNQEQGLDYTETFSPVAKMPTIRVLILLALYHDWTIHQLDVSNAFLHGNLTDTVYMQQPPGFQDSIHPNYVCKLKKALYGLKQSPREWYATLSTHLQDFGFKISTADHSLLIYNADKIQMYILIYVDDILLTGNSPTEINRLLANLNSRFQMRNLGPLSQFLGIQAIRTPVGLTLHQQQYAKNIMQRAGMTNAKPVTNPISCKVVLKNNSQEPFQDPQLYRHLIGSLQYLTLTRPDIQFSVHQLCQHMHRPLNIHYEALKRLLRYIQGTSNTGIPLHKDKLLLRGYVDADWASNNQDRKSISGYCNFLGASLISWQVKKQNTVARSSTEAEYRALATEAAEVIWLRRLLEELNIPQNKPTTVYCDNTSAIALANNPVFHARTKHIEVDCHFIRDCIRNNQIAVHHICTTDQIADVFTKPLTTARFKELTSKLITAPLPSV
ncbi:Retrovirus-related Pol polyprotein from transposon TNT 1-94 [Dendrobium catenatum]|uniref:Retrovirus-related Pol polyprotein from transposon TNT 1-94 n=1 Tax=Dendrobium catenatum TaxID=906689 RepID=A0A2I0XGT8_9ASPA|nr:Retrovirus-related Pol polyprotein from transposon TNT 1-94 [Dendrobium catenatum]